MKELSTRTFLSLLVLTCIAGASFAQRTAGPVRLTPAPSWAYDVVAIVPPAGASITTGADVNEAGVVVGTSYFASLPGERGWVWTLDQGLQLLPPPPVGSSYRAIGVNDLGTIAGDGGVDFGVGWRLSGGVYEVLGTLDGDVRSTVARINNASEIVGTSRTLSIVDPPDSYRAVPGAPLELVLASSQAASLNDLGQVVGWTSSLAGYRWTPGTGLEILPALGQHVHVFPSSINAHGDVVGSATHANGNARVPFLFTDTGGMQPIGAFGGGAAAADLDDSGTVVGNLSSGGDFPWIWTPGGGLRFLDDLIDPALGLNLLAVKRITNSGLLLCRATDASFARYPVLLVPTGG